MQDTIPTLKVLFVGDGGVGKTCFIQRHFSGDFDPKYEPTFGVEISRLVFATNYGPLRFECWDIAGQEKCSSHRENYQGADALILMFDLCSRSSYHNISVWKKDVLKVTGNIPVVVCGNKSDLKEPRVIVKNLDPNESYFEVSAKSNYNFIAPFVEIARTITGFSDLKFV